MAKGLRELITNCSRRFIIIPVVMEGSAHSITEAWAHSNVIIVDTSSGTYERFEPNGGVTSFYDNDLFNKQIQYSIGTLLPSNYKYVKPNDFCPYLGPQYKSSRREGEKGLCTVWTAMYTYMRIINPNYTREQVVADINFGTPDMLLKRVNKFMNFMMTTLKS